MADRREQVWAYHGVQSRFVNTTDWTAIPFGGLPDLYTKMRAESCTHVDRLCIVAHGDRNGYVDLDPPLTWETVDGMRGDVVKLGQVLNAGARVIFYACTAGGGVEGDRLLTKLSSMWPGRDVIGFNTANETAGPTPGPGAVKSSSKTALRNDEWSNEAKWAHNGKIVRAPLFEFTYFQEHDPLFKNRCGSDGCPGHGAYGHSCDPYNRRTWPTWVVSRNAIEKLKASGAGGKAALPEAKSVGSPQRDRVHPRAPAYPAGTGNFRRRDPVR
ncbi:DUF4347 domain-containing protein [Candidatus Binatia bacterium]|nr:DUF4347 domain-containing protein [Candidatus Binatia bacterium]